MAPPDTGLKERADGDVMIIDKQVGVARVVCIFVLVLVLLGLHYGHWGDDDFFEHAGPRAHPRSVAPEAPAA